MSRTYKGMIVLSGAFALLLVGMFINIYYQSSTYPKRTFESYTHINNYKVDSEYRDNLELFLQVQINPKDGDKLLKLHPFSYGYNSIDLKGQVQDDRLSQSGNSWYYLEMHGHYRYLCLCLSNDKKKVQLLEIFGE